MGLGIIVSCLILLGLTALFGVYVYSHENSGKQVVKVAPMQFQQPAILANVKSTPTITDTASSSSTTTIYKSKKYRFSIEYSSDWEVHDEVLKSTVYFAPKDQRIDDLTKTDVGIISMEIDPDKANLEQVLGYFNIIYSEMIISYKLESSSYTEIDGVEAQKMVITGKMDGKKVKMTQYNIIKGKRLYVLNYSAKASEYNKYSSDFEKMTGSFRMI